MDNIALKETPFNLTDPQLAWVEKTRDEMSLEAKIGQLFFLMGFTAPGKRLKALARDFKPGGMMYRTAGMKKISKAYQILQENSSIPLLLAANLEAGGNGLLKQGTPFGNQMLVAATDDAQNARRLGLVCGREARAVGANMAFAPVMDINYNFRNPITNTRSYGDDSERVAAMGAAYVGGAREAGISVTIKHFPGDGTDGRDQHLLTTPNNLSPADWMKAFGKVYSAGIEAGARGLMVGHISFPAYMSEFHKDKPELRDKPATLNPVLMNELLRDKLGFKGLTIIDSSLMTGFGAQGHRSDLVPQSIAAGCDMFLFTRDPKEDYEHMMNGWRNGVLTEQRLNEAVTRILAMKASLGLPEKTVDELVPRRYQDVATAEHKAWSREAADQAITLVKDTQNLLPLDASKHRRLAVIYNGNEGGRRAIMNDMPGLKGMLIRAVMNLGGKEKKPYEKLVDRLNARSFQAFHYSFGDVTSLMNDITGQTLREWVSGFDAIIYLTKWEVLSNQTSLQLQYTATGVDAPWWINEVPTMLISLGSPYHGYDLPMMETVVNAYDCTDSVYESLVEKLTGKSRFRGTSPIKLNFREFDGDLSKWSDG